MRYLNSYKIEEKKEVKRIEELINIVENMKMCYQKLNQVKEVKECIEQIYKLKGNLS